MTWNTYDVKAVTDRLDSILAELQYLNRDGHRTDRQLAEARERDWQHRKETAASEWDRLGVTGRWVPRLIANGITPDMARNMQDHELGRLRLIGQTRIREIREALSDAG